VRRWAAQLAMALAVLAPAVARADVSTLGGPVMHVQRTHVIFWNPAGAGLQFDPGYEQLIDTFLRQVASASGRPDNEFGLLGQYHGPGGPAAYDSTFAGAVDASDPVPTGSGSGCHEPPPPPAGEGPGWNVCVNDAGLQSEIRRVVQTERLPVGLEDIYFVVLPRGFASCFDSGPSDCALGGDAQDGYCGYHADIGSARILYAVIPYNALAGHCRSDQPRPNQNAADPTISTLAHEYVEMATDPLGDGWTDASGNEIADLCLRKFGPALGGSSGDTAYNQTIDGGHYYLQELWSNYGHRCAAAAPADRVRIAAPTYALPHVRTALLARATAPGRRVISYAWTFGDGALRRRRLPRTGHTWVGRGRYTITVTVTDSWGDRATATRSITVG
jgi:hypothetical protein